jgi:hypothetical protein
MLVAEDAHLSHSSRMATTFFPESTSPRLSDDAVKSLQKINALLEAGGGQAPAPGTYDSIVMDPPAKPTTITYKIGGVSGTTVRTVTIAYDGDDVSSVTWA